MSVCMSITSGRLSMSEAIGLRPSSSRANGLVKLSITVLRLMIPRGRSWATIGIATSLGLSVKNCSTLEIGIVGSTAGTFSKSVATVTGTGTDGRLLDSFIFDSGGFIWNADRVSRQRVFNLCVFCACPQALGRLRRSCFSGSVPDAAPAVSSLESSIAVSATAFGIVLPSVFMK